MQPFTDIQTRLAERVAALKYIDEDWGQLDYYEGHPPVKFPCALIDCGGISVSQAGGGAMMDRVSVTVRVADMRLSNSSNAAPIGQKTANYALFDTIGQITAALHGWTGSPTDYGRLQRTAQHRLRRQDGIRMYEIVFECLLTNRSAMRQFVAVQAVPQVNIVD